MSEINSNVSAQNKQKAITMIYSTPVNSRRFMVAESAREEVAALHGALFANSVLAIYDQGRSTTVYGPISSHGTIDMAYLAPLFSDQVEQI